MSINTQATSSPISNAKLSASATLIPEPFVRSINDDRDMDQTLYPSPDANGIQIMKNSDLVIDSQGNLYVSGPILISEKGYGASALSKITPAGGISIVTLSISEQLTSMAIDSQDNIYISAYSGPGYSDSNAGGGGYSMVPKFISRLTDVSPFFTAYKLQPDGQLSLFIPRTEKDCFFNFAVDSNGALYSDSFQGLIKMSNRRFLGRKKELLINFAAGSTALERSAPAMATDRENNLIYVEHNILRGNAQNKPEEIDGSYDLIKKISPAGDISTIAGIQASAESKDGSADKAAFQNITSLAVDSKDNIYILESKKKTVRKLSAGIVSTLVSDVGTDAISIAMHGDKLYILRKAGIDVVRNLPL